MDADLTVAEHRFHKTPFRIPFSDVDMAGVVYTPHYTDYLLKGWEDYFECIGIPWKSFVGGPVIKGLPVAKIEITFISPARYGDDIDILTRITRVTQKRLFFGFEIRAASDARLIVKSAMEVAAFGSDAKATPIPAFINDAINRHR